MRILDPRQRKAHAYDALLQRCQRGRREGERADL